MKLLPSVLDESIVAEFKGVAVRGMYRSELKWL